MVECYKSYDDIHLVKSMDIGQVSTEPFADVWSECDAYMHGLIGSVLQLGMLLSANCSHPTMAAQLLQDLFLSEPEDGCCGSATAICFISREFHQDWPFSSAAFSKAMLHSAAQFGPVRQEHLV